MFFAPGHAPHVRAEEHVGEEEDLLVGRNRVDDLDRVAGRAAVVALRLHLGRRVDVRDDDGARMLRLPLAQLLGVDRRGERAAGGEIRQQHGLLRRQNRRRLGHEVHAAEDDDVGVGLRRLAGQAERVADEIGDVLDLGPLVVVREDDRVPRRARDRLISACSSAICACRESSAVVAMRQSNSLVAC